MKFKNRYDVAMQLIPLLEKYRNENGIVLAVPRGGVPIAYHIAKSYNMPLDLLLTKKIGHPLNSELAVGAASMEGYTIDERFNIKQAYIDNEVKKITEALKVSHQKFLGNRKPFEVKDKVVIIIDDGIATGNTLLSAIKMIRSRDPKKIVVAVPVAPVKAANRIKKEADDFICLHTPQEFYGVGQFYNDFSEVDDVDVIRLLNETSAEKKIF